MVPKAVIQALQAQRRKRRCLDEAGEPDADGLAAAVPDRAGQNDAMSDLPWKAHEKQIVDLVKNRASPGTQIATNVRVPGLVSGVKRQVDVLVKGSFAGIADAVMVLDCKCFGTKVDVKDVEAFLGMLEDIGANMGMLVTTKGFSKAAKLRATAVIQEIVPLIDIVLLDQMTDWWMVRAGESGRYVGDYVDHEPYGGFWWRVLFVTGGYDADGGFTDEEEDILSTSDIGGGTRRSGESGCSRQCWRGIGSLEIRPPMSSTTSPRL